MKSLSISLQFELEEFEKIVNCSSKEIYSSVFFFFVFSLCFRNLFVCLLWKEKCEGNRISKVLNEVTPLFFIYQITSPPLIPSRLPSLYIKVKFTCRLNVINSCCIISMVLNLWFLLLYIYYYIIYMSLCFIVRLLY